MNLFSIVLLATDYKRFFPVRPEPVEGSERSYPSTSSGRTERIHEHSEWIKTERGWSAAFTPAVPDVALCKVWEFIEGSGRTDNNYENEQQLWISA